MTNGAIRIEKNVLRGKAGGEQLLPDRALVVEKKRSVPLMKPAAGKIPAELLPHPVAATMGGGTEHGSQGFGGGSQQGQPGYGPGRDPGPGSPPAGMDKGARAGRGDKRHTQTIRRENRKGCSSGGIKETVRLHAGRIRAGKHKRVTVHLAAPGEAHPLHTLRLQPAAAGRCIPVRAEIPGSPQGDGKAGAAGKNTGKNKRGAVTTPVGIGRKHYLSILWIRPSPIS